MSDDTFRKPLAEADLRAAKEEVVERMSDQARALGMEPRVAGIEDFVAPILAKVERDHEALVRSGKDPASKAGQPARERVDRQGVEVKSEDLGEIDFRSGQFRPNAKGAEVLAARKRQVSLEQRALVHAMRIAKYDPDFEKHRRIAQKISLTPGSPMVKRSAMNLCMESFLQEYTAKYGDPRFAVLSGRAEQLEEESLKKAAAHAPPRPNHEQRRAARAQQRRSHG